MGEEGTELRLAQLEHKEEIRDKKQETRDKKQDDMNDKFNDKFNTIEKLNVKQDISLNIIVFISKALLTAFIVLIASNIWMFLSRR